MQRGVFLHKLGREAISVAQHILVYQHLPVAVFARPDAYGQGTCALGHQSGKRLRHTLQRDGKGTRLRHSLRIGEQPSCGLLGLALHLESAERVKRLRGQSDMRHHGNTCFHDGPDAVGVGDTALQLHRLAVGLLHDTPGVGQRIVDRGLVRHKGHVDDHKGVFGTPAYSLTVVYHVVNGHGERVVVAQHHVAERVADQNHVYPCLVDGACRVIIVCREHTDDTLSLLLQEVIGSMFHFLRAKLLQNP